MGYIKQMPEEERGYTEFWFDKEHNSFADKFGNDPETLGANWKAFTDEMQQLGVTGMYINDLDQKITIHVNKSGGEKEPKWDDIEPKILEAIQKYL